MVVELALRRCRCFYVLPNAFPDSPELDRALERLEAESKFNKLRKFEVLRSLVSNLSVFRMLRIPLLPTARHSSLMGNESLFFTGLPI